MTWLEYHIDGGDTLGDFIETTFGQYVHVECRYGNPNNVYGGIQDNGSWKVLHMFGVRVELKFHMG